MFFLKSNTLSKVFNFIINISILNLCNFFVCFLCPGSDLIICWHDLILLWDILRRKYYDYHVNREEIEPQRWHDYPRFLCWISYLVSDLKVPKYNLSFFTSTLEYISKTYPKITGFFIIILLYLVRTKESYKWFVNLKISIQNHPMLVGIFTIPCLLIS